MSVVKSGIKSSHILLLNANHFDCLLEVKNFEGLSLNLLLYRSFRAVDM